jgi:hypothetical protein
LGFAGDETNPGTGDPGIISIVCCSFVIVARWFDDISVAVLHYQPDDKDKFYFGRNNAWSAGVMQTLFVSFSKRLIAIHVFHVYTVAEQLGIVPTRTGGTIQRLPSPR